MSDSFGPILARKPYTEYPDDAFLEVVLHTNFKGEYCTHVLNKQTGGFAHGHYYHGQTSEALESAVHDYNLRGVRTLLLVVEVKEAIAANEIAALLEVIKQQTFALDSLLNLSADLTLVARRELAKFARMGHDAMTKHGIEG